MSAPNRGAVQRVARKVKQHLLCVFIAFGAGAGATWYYSETVFGLLLAPAGGELSPHGGLPIFIVPTDMLNATINLSMMGGAVAALPMLLVGGFRLLSPFLNRRQRRFAALFLPAILLCFLGGAAFAYFVMLPVGLRFLLHFGAGIAVATIRITEYMSLVAAMLFWLGVVFELPPIMFLLAKFRIVSFRRFRMFQKYVPAAAFILSIFITPTVDFVNQAFVAVPMIVLFEVGLFLAWLAEGGHRALARKAGAAAAGLWRRLLAALARGRAWVGRACRKALTKAAFWRRG